MIQCWRSREENRNYCSRVCCAQALKNIRVLKQRRPDLPVYVLYRDIMSYGFSEHYYTEARKLGAIFIRYDLNHKPNVTFANGKPVIKIWDELLQNTIELNPDMLVLSVGIDPNDNSELAEIFNVPLTQNGFFQEAESKWRPVDFLKQGVFMCGIAHAPGTMNETIASAKAAAQRALQILSRKGLSSSNTVAEVKHTLCSRCGACVEVCPYGGAPSGFSQGNGRGGRAALPGLRCLRRHLPQQRLVSARLHGQPGHVGHRRGPGGAGVAGGESPTASLDTTTSGRGETC